MKLSKLRTSNFGMRKSPQKKIQPKMRNNDSGSASFEDKHQCEELVIEIIEPCIYKVPKKLRNINKEAYTPQLISIGPFHLPKINKKVYTPQLISISPSQGISVSLFHHDEEELANMQKQKRRYEENFLNRIGRKRFEKLKKLVKANEKHIRNYYAESISEVSCPDFIEMILCDAAFIFELFLRNYHDDRSDFLLNKPWLRNAIELDLLLLENQLPYPVLKKLYISAFASFTEEVSPSFITICCKFFKYHDVVKSNEINFKHFLDIRRYAMLAEITIPSKGDSLDGKIEDLPSAVKLNESGVKLKPNKEGKSWLDIKFKKRKASFIPCCTGEELQIPRIRIEDSTECLIRNLMALEQCHYPSETHICNYIDLMDSLINTTKDVDLLVEKGIISNCVGDHNSIKEMFNKLCLEITPSNSCYNYTITKLKKHHEKWWNRTKATLISVYFTDLWRGTGTVAAVILLVLTLLQTMQRFFPHIFSSSKH